MERKYLTKEDIDDIIAYKMTYGRNQFYPHYDKRTKALLYLFHLAKLTKQEILRLRRADFRKNPNRVITYQREVLLPKTVMPTCEAYFREEPEKNNAFNLHKPALFNSLGITKAKVLPRRYLVL